MLSQVENKSGANAVSTTTTATPGESLEESHNLPDIDKLFADHKVGSEEGGDGSRRVSFCQKVVPTFYPSNRMSGY